MKKMLFILVSMLCLLLSAGCGSDKQAAQAPAADKVLRVATSPASPPFELYLKEQNKFTGFDIDLINDVAKKMGYDKVEFINTPFDELLPGLNQKKYDIASVKPRHVPLTMLQVIPMPRLLSLLLPKKAANLKQTSTA